jgi:hypothetical protein
VLVDLNKIEAREFSQNAFQKVKAEIPKTVVSSVGVIK